jgi:putative hydrolase of the HAD superfamily
MRHARAPRSAALGLAPKTVRLAPHDPRWRGLAARLGRDLRRAVGAQAKRIVHVGSTAVPGLPAKPVIDMQVEVASLATGRRLLPRLSAIGFELRDDDAIPGRLYCVRNVAGRRQAQLHLVAAGGGQANDRIAFRDRLRREPWLATRYLRLKRALARRHPHDRIAYAMAKHGFVDAALRRAPARPRKPTPPLARAAWRELQTRRAAGRSMPAQDTRSPAPVWLFDLDNTLHDASHAIFSAIDRRMTDYVERTLGVTRDEANRLRVLYWRRYGATLLGLIRHHDVDPHDFLRTAHDFDAAALLRAERGLARLFARLPGRKVLLTNAPHAYAGSVLRALRLQPHFGTRYAIEHLRLHGRYRPKPSRPMLRALLARERIVPARAVLVEDSLPNLASARALGLRTVLITRHGSTATQRYRGRVGLIVGSLHELARRQPR